MNIFGKIWNWFTKSKTALEIETLAIKAVASELEAVADKFLGADTPIDKALDALINEAAAKIISSLPQQAVAAIANSAPKVSQ